MSRPAHDAAGGSRTHRRRTGGAVSLLPPVAVQVGSVSEDEVQEVIQEASLRKSSFGCFILHTSFTFVARKQGFITCIMLCIMLWLSQQAMFDTSVARFEFRGRAASMGSKDAVG